MKDAHGRKSKTLSRKNTGRPRCASFRGGSSCCGSKPAAEGRCDPDHGQPLRRAVRPARLPEEAVLASLGCGNPTALAQSEPGRVVLDLGSRRRHRRVCSRPGASGPAGKAYGLDMTDEMLALARREPEARRASTNVEFLKGEIENIPLPDNTVDVIISNCVINLSADKDRVLAEAFRVLKPGGRFAVSDVVVRGEIPPEIRRSVELVGRLPRRRARRIRLQAKLAAAGFTEISIEPTRVYRVEDAREFLSGHGIDVDAIAPLVDGRFFSGSLRATKP